MQEKGKERNEEIHLNLFFLASDTSPILSPARAPDHGEKQKISFPEKREVGH
jgi:hypothetical protein